VEDAVTKADRDNARFLPVEAECVWAFQVDFDHLESLSTCMEMLEDYGYRLSARVMLSSKMLAVVVDGSDGTAQSVGHLDWIVFTGGEVKTISQQAFHGVYRKMTKEER
jgi:hypothetical protein